MGWHDRWRTARAGLAGPRSIRAQGSACPLGVLTRVWGHRNPWCPGGGWYEAANGGEVVCGAWVLSGRAAATPGIPWGVSLVWSVGPGCRMRVQGRGLPVWLRCQRPGAVAAQCIVHIRWRVALGATCCLVQARGWPVKGWQGRAVCRPLGGGWLDGFGVALARWVQSEHGTPGVQVCVVVSCEAPRSMLRPHACRTSAACSAVCGGHSALLPRWVPEKTDPTTNDTRGSLKYRR